MISKTHLNKIIGRLGLEVHGKGYLQSLAKGEFKEDCFQIQQELIKIKCPLIFDIGANRGNITEKYLKTFPSPMILAFEPFPDSFEILHSRFSGNKKVSCFQKAAASIAGQKNFYVNKNVDTNSLLRPQKTGLSSDEQVNNISTISVDTIILDEFCKVENISHIDILKMDIQGGEFDALLGLNNLLAKREIDLIYSEVYFVEQYERQPLFHDISKLLFQYGYQLQDIYNPIYGKGSIAWADVIFIKNHKSRFI